MKRQLNSSQKNMKRHKNFGTCTIRLRMRCTGYGTVPMWAPMKGGENVMVSVEDMKGCIQEWFAEALSTEDLREVYYAVRAEADKQFDYMVIELTKQQGGEQE